MPELVTIPNVTLIETGTWMASTGEVTFTSSDLYAAVAALDDPAVKTPRMRFGHTAPGTGLYDSAGGFDEQPCVGKFTNLRVEDDGNSLVGDLVGVPAWLAEILPVAYPSRSVEAYFGVETSTGKKHEMIVTSVALLGENLPAVQTLDDLEIVFSEEGSEEWIQALTAQSMVAASSQKVGDPVPAQRVAASTDLSDVRSAFYDQIATEESGRYWWWLHQIYIDPAVVIAEDDDGEFWLIPYDAKSAEMGDPVQVFIQWVEAESGKVAAAKLDIKKYGHPTAVYASAASSRPAGRQQQFESTTKKEAKGSMPIDTSLVAKRLGLPEDATEEQINEALAQEPETPPSETPETPESPETPEQPETPAPEETPAEDPAAVMASGVTVDKETWERVQNDAAAGREAKAKQDKDRRTAIVKAAIKDRKIPPSREAHYMGLIEKDEKGTTDFLNSLQKDAVPGDEIGTAENPEEGIQAQQGTGLLPELARQEA